MNEPEGTCPPPAFDAQASAAAAGEEEQRLMESK